MGAPVAIKALRVSLPMPDVAPTKTAMRGVVVVAASLMRRALEAWISL